MTNFRIPDSFDELLDLLENDSRIRKKQLLENIANQEDKDTKEYYSLDSPGTSGRFRDEIASATGSLRQSLFYGKVIEHPLIAFTLSLTRRPSSDNEIRAMNGNSLITISTREIEGIGEPPLPCCKPSRAFCILLLKKLSEKKINNSVIGIEIGSNLAEEGYKLGVARSGKLGKADFREHITRVYACEYNNDKFGLIDDLYGKKHIIIDGEMANEIRDVTGKYDEAIFSEFMDTLTTERLKQLKTTYALDMYLIIADRLMFNKNKSAQLVRWKELHPLNGWKLANIEDYIEEMRRVFYLVVQDRKDVKLTKEGLQFFPNGS